MTQNTLRPTDRDAAQKPSLTIWYNTLCPICDRGITWQKRLLMPAVKAGQVDFLDINQQPTALAAYGVSLEAIRQRLHATTATGALLIGGDVVIAIMAMTPGQRWLARVLGNRVMRPITCFLYDRFAVLLYRWNKRRGHW